MFRLLLAWIANSLAIWAVAYAGFLEVATPQDAFLAGALLTLINAIVRPILVVLTLPLTVLTLGLFYFVITGFCLWLTAHFIHGFAVHGVLMTIVASILVSLVSTLISRILHKAQ